MKMKNILVAGTLMFALTVSAQKDELKSLKKIYDKDTPSAGDVTEYKALLAKLEPLATDEASKVSFNYYKAVLPQIEIASTGTAPTQAQLQNLFTPKAVTEMAKAYKATLDYEKKTGKKVFTDDINEDIKVVSPLLFNAGMGLVTAKKQKEAATLFYAAYLLENDQDNLFYAASYAVNAQDYEQALSYYLELKKLNYSGEKTSYYAINKASKKEEYFKTKDQRDSFIKVGSHEKPREEKQASQRGEIYKNIALILVDQGKKEEAKQAFIDAKKANPDDTSLLLNEANLYLNLNDFDTYSKLVNEVLQKDPNNATLVFNLGVVSSNANKIDIAEGYYKKAIELDPNYFEPYINLAELKMRGDQKYVDEINKLGTSDKELKRYEVLKTERNKNFTAILPLLEKAVSLKPEDESAKKALLSIYNALEMTDKYKALKAKM